MAGHVTVLGIYDGHDAGASIVRNGSVVAAVSEERPRTIKHYVGIPEESIRLAFQTAQISPSEIDTIALAGRWFLGEYPAQTAGRAKLSTKTYLYEKLSPYLSSPFFTNLQVRVFSRFRRIEQLRKALEGYGLEDKEIMIVEHHAAHAACAYYLNPSDGDRLVLTFDGSGDGVSSTVNIGRSGKIERLAYSTYYHSVCNTLYSEVTAYLGMKRWDHEYKVMGLAPYGSPDSHLNVMRKLIRIDEKNPLVFRNTCGACNTQVYNILRKNLDGARFDNVAASVQRRYEELLCEWVENSVKNTGIHKIACAGGGFLNVKANKSIREIPEVEEAFFFPAAGDEGLAVGAALEAYYRYCERDGRRPDKVPLSELYLGPSFSDESIEDSLKKSKTGHVQRIGESNDEILKLVLQGKILAWFDGKMEFGPRALGHRSIIADPRRASVKRTLNSQIKMRDWFMPFAPSIIEEASQDYLVNSCYAPYMILAFDTTKRWPEIEAAIHPQDLTARPQVVRRSWNSRYWSLIDGFRSATGIGALLNTSFNLHGYPIVCTPDQAIWTFNNSKLDAMVLGSYLVTRS